MSHTNSTTNYNLPQFLTTDKPAWLTDINNAFYDIDGTMKNNADAASAAQGDATTALSNAAAAQSTATAADGKGTGAIASIADTFDPTSTYTVGDYVMYNSLLYICTTAVTVPGAWNAGSWQRTTVETILAAKANSANLATVATTGSYNSLSNKPITPTFAGPAVVDFGTTGTGVLSFSFLRVTSTPSCIVVTGTTMDNAIIQYDSNASTSQVVLKGRKLDGTVLNSLRGINLICYQ